MANVGERAAKPAGDGDDRWVLRAADRALIGNKTGATRLGFAVLLKLFAAEGRFPRRAEDVPLAAVEAVANQVGVAATAWPGYDWRGRTIEYHRAQIRTALGFREATLEEAEALGRWLDSQVLALERRPDRLLVAARERCRNQSVEPPSPERLERLVRSVLHRHEEAFCAALLARLAPEAIAGVGSPAAPARPGKAAGPEPRLAPPLLALRGGTGQASLQSVGEEAAFAAAWVEGLDVNEPDTIRWAAQRAGMDGSELLAAAAQDHPGQDARAALRAFDAHACPGVPTVVIEGERFFEGPPRLD